jgi:oligo-alginate lyase
VELHDGPNGDQGGVGFLRSGPVSDQSLLVMKYTAHGESHGHYDKLGIIYYDQNREILQDYGAVRFINVEPKDGGRYLPETSSWARQTIAHNTLTVDEQSHYGGRFAISSTKHADRHFFSAADSNLQVMSAKVLETYPGVQMQRTVALVRDPAFSKPIVIDILRVESPSLHQYDLPFYYMGQLVYSSATYKAFDRQRVPLGTANGYQHLWKEAEGKCTGPFTVTWLNGGRYYSVIAAADSNTSLLFSRIGASDPDFNLRNDPAFMVRLKDSTHVFASVLEPHGFFDPVPEISNGARPKVESVKILASTAEGSVVEIMAATNRWVFMVANGQASETATHALTANGTTYAWTGNYSLRKM